MLIQHGADLNVQNNIGKTALLLACTEGILEIFEMLLNHGADITLCDVNGNTAKNMTKNIDILRLFVVSESAPPYILK